MYVCMYAFVGRYFWCVMVVVRSMMRGACCGGGCCCCPIDFGTARSLRFFGGFSCGVRPLLRTPPPFPPHLLGARFSLRRLFLLVLCLLRSLIVCLPSVSIPMACCSNGQTERVRRKQEGRARSLHVPRASLRHSCKQRSDRLLVNASCFI